MNVSDNESSKLATRKWYIINNQNNGQYGRGNENDSTIKFETKVIELNLCDYLDAYILLTRDIKVADVAADTNVEFKTCTLFTRCVTHINDEHVETAENLDIIMPPIVTLLTKDNVNLTKQLNEGLKRSVYWNEYKSKVETKETNYQTLTKFLIDASFEEVNRLFVLAFNDDNNDANRVKRNSRFSSQE